MKVGEDEIRPVNSEVAAVGARSRQRALEIVWNTDAPEGYAWKCPDCTMWATIGGNAGYHSTVTKHGVPRLVPNENLLREQDEKIAEARDEYIFSRNEIRAVMAALGLGAAVYREDIMGLLVKASGHKFLDEHGLVALVRKLSR